MSNQRFPGRPPLSRGQNYDNSSYAASAAPRDAPTAPYYDQYAASNDAYFYQPRFEYGSYSGQRGPAPGSRGGYRGRGVPAPGRRGGLSGRGGGGGSTGGLSDAGATLMEVHDPAQSYQELDAPTELDKRSVELDKRATELEKRDVELDKRAAELEKRAAADERLRTEIAGLKRQLDDPRREGRGTIAEMEEQVVRDDQPILTPKTSNAAQNNAPPKRPGGSLMNTPAKRPSPLHSVSRSAASTRTTRRPDADMPSPTSETSQELNSATDDITQWRMKLRMPGQPDAPEEFATFIHAEFCKLLKDHAKRQKQWKNSQPSDEVCILVRVVGKLKHSVFPDKARSA
jgi:hypothetical protein